MFAYQLRIAWKSLKRSPVLSTLLVLGIALGIGVSTAFVTTYYLMARDPLPGRSTELFRVQIDNWRPERPWDDERPEEPPDQISWVDAVNLMASDIPTRQSAMFKSSLTVHPAGEGERPFRAMTRVTGNDFFGMFEVPFAWGGPWDDAADREAEPVLVLDHATNLRLFGGEDSVGRKVQVEDRDFTVVGVLAPWRPTIKFYDTSNSEFQEPEELYIPFSLVRPMELPTAGNTSGWKSYAGSEFEDFLQSEMIWIQMWVELPDASGQAAYRDWLDAYVREQQTLGRLPREMNNRVRDVREWMEVEEVVPDEATTLLVISLLFMVVCSVNLIGILLGKFLARAPEVGVRRALGASRASVFVQHLVECELLGLLGGVLGLGLSVLALGLINRLLADVTADFHLDWTMVGAGLLLSLVAGLIAGVYPSWRICRVPPASYLKIQ
jgi:putative ABC transport system permease protein